jgi:hypothetical protein
MAVCLHAGGDSDSGDNAQSPICFSLPLIICGFAGLNFFDDVLNYCLRQGLIPKSIISDDFYFVSTFLPLAKPATKSRTFVIPTVGSGGRE